MHNLSRFTFVFLLGLFLSACGKDGHDACLDNIAAYIQSDPQRAVAALDSIDVNNLSTSDRHYHNFLTVKARDKAYIFHTSDSLIRIAADYYSKNETELFPEVMYYCGRVYSDMGDLPEALTCFQKAIEIVPEDNLRLRSVLYSQTGRLLNTLRQYSQAAPYLKMSLQIDSLEEDTFNLAYNHQLLGAIYMHQTDYDAAMHCMEKARMYATYLSDKDVALMDVYRAGIQYRRGNNADALNLIRDNILKIREIDRSTALAFATKIYYSAGLYDTAMIYAKLLINSRELGNRKTGYKYLFKEGIKNLLAPDSVEFYMNNYSAAVESVLKARDTESTMIQSSMFNYSVRERDLQDAENVNGTLTYVVIGLLGIIAVSGVAYLSGRRRSKVRAKETLLKIQELQVELSNIQDSGHDKSSDNENEEAACGGLEELKLKPISSQILNSSVFRQVNRCCENKAIIAEHSELWDEIEELVKQDSPRFCEFINSGYCKGLDALDRHIICLIRLGIGTTQQSYLIGRSKSSVSYRRRKICETMFGADLKNIDLNSLIRAI